MALYTPDEITAEIRENAEFILAQAHPEDSAHEYADSALPIYYNEIIEEWRDLPDEFSNRFAEIIGDLPDRIEDLMRADLWLYYESHYGLAIAELVEARDLAEVGE